MWALAATPLTGFMLVTFALFTLLLVLIMLAGRFITPWARAKVAA